MEKMKFEVLTKLYEYNILPFLVSFFFFQTGRVGTFFFFYELGLVHTSNPVAGWRFGSKMRAIISSSES